MRALTGVNKQNKLEMIIFMLSDDDMKDKDMFENMPELSSGEKMLLHQILEKCLASKETVEQKMRKGFFVQMQQLSNMLRDDKEIIYEMQDVSMMLVCLKAVRDATQKFIREQLSTKEKGWEQLVGQSYHQISHLAIIYAKFMLSKTPPETFIV